MSEANAARAGVSAVTRVQAGQVNDLQRPDGPPGIVIVNPPYGTRIGNKGPLFGLHGQMGTGFRDRFPGVAHRHGHVRGRTGQGHRLPWEGTGSDRGPWRA